MGSVYPRKDSPYLWWSYTGPTGKRVSGRSPYRKGQERAARRALSRIESAVATRREPRRPIGSRRSPSTPIAGPSRARLEASAATKKRPATYASTSSRASVSSRSPR